MVHVIFYIILLIAIHPSSILYFSPLQFSPLHYLIPISSMIVGICLQQYVAISTPLLFTVAIISLFIFCMTLATKNKWPTALSCIQLFIVVGAFTYSLQTDTYKNIQQLLPKNKTSPSFYVSNKTNTRSAFYKETLQLQLNDLTIACYLPRETEIIPGDFIILENIHLKPPKKGVTITGNPTFDLYLMKENIHATLFLKTPCYKIVTKQRGFTSWIFEKREKLFYALERKMPEKTFAFFSGIFLGNKNETPIGDEKLPFYYWGLAHHLARSGLHIALFILAWSFIFSLLPIPLVFRHIFLLLLCLIYTIFSWSSISFVRAIAVFFLYKIGHICNRPTHSLYLLFLVTFTILYFNPVQLFFLDFQLSFGLTAILIIAITEQKREFLAPKEHNQLAWKG